MKIILFLIVLTGCEAALANSKIDIILPSIVSILPIWDAGAGNMEEPEGSGIAIGDGSSILTAAHVLRGAKDLKIRTYHGEIINAAIVWIDEDTDIALLNIDKKLQPAAIFPAGNLGSPVCAIGNSFGLGISLSCGVISAVGRTGIGFNAIEDFIQTDAAVNPGKSGGALVNEKGQVVGMLSAIFTKKSDANIGVNFAVSSRLLKSVLKNKLKPGFAWRKNPFALLSHPPKGYSGRAGASIVQIGKTVATHRTGLKIGDIIIRAGNRNITKPSDFRTEYAMFEGAKLKIVVLRENREMLFDWHFNNQDTNLKVK